MKSNRLRFSAAIVVLFLLSACARPVSIVPETSKAAFAAIDRIVLMNQGLIDFKGIGRMKLVHSGRAQIARMAWAGTLPDMLRLEFMGAPGVTLATMASDGKWFYLRLEQEGRFYKKGSDKALFRRIVDIPVTVREVAQILSGKIPLAPHAYAELSDTSLNQYALVLKDNRGEPQQRIFFYSDQHRPFGFEVFDANGSVSFRVEFRQMMPVDGHVVPQFLVLSNPKGERFELTVEKYWVNAPLPPSRYTLQP